MLRFFKNTSLSFSTMFISLALVVYPATVLLVPKLNGLIFALFAFSGLYVLFKYRDKSCQASKDEKLFYLSLSLFFVVSLLITINGGFVYKDIGKYLHLIFAIPVYLYLRHFGLKLSALWFGLVVGTIAAAGVAIYDVWILNSSRARGLTHPIIFGDLALLMGCMAMAGTGWFKRRANWQLVFPVLALFSGVFASVLSESRGGWIAIPAIFLVFFWSVNSIFSLKQKVIMLLSVIIFSSIVYLVPQTQVNHHIERTMNSLQQYSDSEINSKKRATSVGGRLEMWQASWEIFLQNPIVGVGWGHYKEHMQKQVSAGERNEYILAFDHPHNEYLSSLASTGVLGFMFLMILFLIPAWLFIQYIKHNKSVEVRRLALAGLILIVAYMMFGISESMLHRSRSVNFFAFYLAVFMAGIYHESRKS